MNVIYEMLAEEKKRNIKMQQAYRSELEKLPKGTICKKIIGNKAYFYLKYRQGKKIISKYVGKDSEQISILIEKIKKRKYLENVIRELRAEYRTLCKVVKD
jgi:hypothetical protein